jgi:hypothetical protein
VNAFLASMDLDGGACHGLNVMWGRHTLFENLRMRLTAFALPSLYATSVSFRLWRRSASSTPSLILHLEAGRCQGYLLLRLHLELKDAQGLLRIGSALDVCQAHFSRYKVTRRPRMRIGKQTHDLRAHAAHSQRLTTTATQKRFAWSARLGTS